MSGRKRAAPEFVDIKVTALQVAELERLDAAVSAAQVQLDKAVAACLAAFKMVSLGKNLPAAEFVGIDAEAKTVRVKPTKAE